MKTVSCMMMKVMALFARSLRKTRRRCLLSLCRWRTSILTAICGYGKNLLISSKSITPKDLDVILVNYLKYKNTSVGQLTLPTLSLSKTESNMLQMWMAGHGTSQISTQMNIKAKTVSSHKGNIKKKIQTHNKQVIYHIVRLTENITSGIQVNMR